VALEVCLGPEIQHQVQPAQGEPWQRFRDPVAKAGQSFWMDEVLLTPKHALLVNLLAHWERGEKEPWLLATNPSSRQETLKVYRRLLAAISRAYELPAHPERQVILFVDNDKAHDAKVVRQLLEKHHHRIRIE
jgi:hypothetical protein